MEYIHTHTHIPLARLVYHRAMLLIFHERSSSQDTLFQNTILLFFHLKHLPTSNPKLNHAYHPWIHLFGVFSDTLVPNV